MNLSFSLESLNVWAVLTGALISFVLGAIWYNPKVFGTAWMTENKFKQEDFEGVNQAVMFGMAIVLYLVSAFFLAIFIGANGTLQSGVITGILTSLVFIGTSIGINYLFERKSFKLWLINVSYSVVTYAIMGGIIGSWK